MHLLPGNIDLNKLKSYCEKFIIVHS